LYTHSFYFYCINTARARAIGQLNTNRSTNQAPADGEVCFLCPNVTALIATKDIEHRRILRPAKEIYQSSRGARFVEAAFLALR
jgi:hypothetical protein